MYAMSDMFYLPPGTIPPMVMPFDPTASVPLCLVSVSNPDMTEKELYDIAYYELRNRLQVATQRLGNLQDERSQLQQKYVSLLDRAKDQNLAILLR